jgi:thiamine phosphate synthase YjbQ (UPF0047 family)
LCDKIENGKSEKNQDLGRHLTKTAAEEAAMGNKDAVDDLKAHLKKELLLSKAAFSSGDEKAALNHFMNALMYRKSLGHYA